MVHTNTPSQTPLNKPKAILVTGGAGYIGSHVVKQLGALGEKVVVLDNLYSGFAESVLSGELVVGHTADKALVKSLIEKHQIDTVMHFAAHTVVPESVSNPLKYYQNNTASTLALLEACVETGVQQFVFSSTAAVYGIPENPLCTESTPTQPINPYGMSKLMSEHMLKDLGASSAMRYVILRYFNVAGSDPEGRIGQSTKNATLLTKVAVEAAIGKRAHVSIFGTDYDTPDGTGVRDYIHVEDLASAHIQALSYLRQQGSSVTLNCGYGHGFSVREVLQTVEKITGTRLTIKEEPRRAGDPPMLIAEAQKIRTLLNWHPRFDSLDEIVRTAFEWEKKLALKSASTS
jgi:UDP-glucose 4-epimerase